MFKDRLKAIVDDKRLSFREFDRITGYSHTNLANAVAGRTTYPKIDLLFAIGEHFPEVNLDWLVMGRGEMYRQSTEVLSEIPADDVALLPENARGLYRQMIEAQQDLISIQREKDELQKRYTDLMELELKRLMKQQEEKE